MAVRPDKRAGTTVHEAEPRNSEPPLPALAERPLTPVDAFYVRSHGPAPSPSDGRLRVDGLVARELDLALDEIRDGRFPVHEVVATLQCAGSRRVQLMDVGEIPGEAPWGPGATGTARWTGVRLADVLEAAGSLDDASDVALVGADQATQAEPTQAYGVSIPLRKARRPEVLLAWAMNGEPLEVDHGAPLRAVVPGFIGARSVKWLERIEVRDAPWEGYFQHEAYRLVPADGEPGPGVGVPLGEVALNADLLAPTADDRLPPGRVELRGYAFAGGERRVARVDVSVDDGATWRGAELEEDLGRWAWRLWRLEADLDPGEHVVRVRAWDSAAGTQPEDPATVWNPKGYVNTAQARVVLTVGRGDGSAPAP